MNETIKKLLKGAGFTDDVITSAEKDDFDASKAVESLHESQKEHYKSLLENEIKEEIKDTITKDRDGKFLGILNTELKKSGVPLEKIQDLEIKDKIKVAAEHYKTEAEKITGKTNEDFKKIQEENLQLKNQLTEKDEWAQTEIGKVKEQVQQERKQEQVELALQKQFTTIPANKVLGGKHSDGLFLALKNMIQTKFDTDLESGNVVFYEKGTKKRIAGKNEQGRDDFKKASDILVEELKGLNFYVESNGQGGEGEKDQNGGAGSGGKQKSGRLIELEKKIEAEQRA